VLGLRIAERGADLSLGRGPDETGDLGKDVDKGENGTSAGVEEMDLAIIGAAASGEEGRLPGRKCKSLNSGAVVENAGMHTTQMRKRV
jgi:hypothetical protein